METVEYLQSNNLSDLVYIFFVFGMLVEGLFFALTAIFLMTTGAVEPLPAVICVAAGAGLEQWLLYYTGRRLNGMPRITKWVNHVTQRFDEHIKNRTLHTLLVSKFIYGFHRAILIRSGMLGVPLRQFSLASFISTVFWLLVVGGFGYFFSESLKRFTRYWSLIDLLPFGLIIVFLLTERLLGKYLKKWL